MVGQYRHASPEEIKKYVDRKTGYSELESLEGLSYRFRELLENICGEANKRQAIQRYTLKKDAIWIIGKIAKFDGLSYEIMPCSYVTNDMVRLRQLSVDTSLQYDVSIKGEIEKNRRDILSTDNIYIAMLGRVTPQSDDDLPLRVDHLYLLDWEESDYQNFASEISDTLNKESKLKEKINELSEEIEIKNSKMHNLNLEITDNEKQLREIRERLDQYKKQLEDTDRRAKIYEEWGILPEGITSVEGNIEEKTSPQLAHPSLKLLAQAVYGCLKLQRNLYYDNFNTRVVDKFLEGIYSNQLIILEGPPGSGKSTFPRVVAELFGGTCTTVAVQSNWVDRNDLLGFYNYQENYFVATEFTLALLEAQKHPGQIHFICLDEMNLSHIEYYFADVLSAMEQKEGKKFIELYPRSVYNRLKSEVDNFIDGREGESIQKERMHYKGALLPWKIELPPNVQIIGTLNMDFTTKGLSPKVLDRSYIINFDISNAEEFTISSLSEEEIKESKNIADKNSELIRKIRVDFFMKDHDQCSCEEINDIVEITNEVFGIDFSVSKRMLRQCEAMRMTSQAAFIMDVLQCKVLPRIVAEFDTEDELNEAISDFVERLSAYYELEDNNENDEDDEDDENKDTYDALSSLKRFLLRKAKGSNVLDYWR